MNRIIENKKLSGEISAITSNPMPIVQFFVQP